MERYEIEQQTKEICEAWRVILSKITGPAKKKVNGQTSYICPLCNHGAHGDGLTRNPKSATEYGLKCFSCGESGSVIDFIMKADHIEFNEARAKAANLAGIQIETYNNAPKMRPEAPQSARSKSDGNLFPNDTKTQPAATETAKTTMQDQTDYYRQCQERLNDPAAITFLQSRGLSIEAAQAAGIGYDPNKYGQRLILPINAGCYTARRIDGKEDMRYWTTPGGEITIWNVDALYSSDAVFVCEGILDALSIQEVGGAAVALNGAGNYVKLIDQLKTKPSTAKIIICLDNDDTGIRDAEALRKGLEDMQQPYIQGHVTGDEKDCNDALKANRAAFTERVLATIDEQPRDVMTDFLECIQGQNYKPLPTSLKFFDKILSGGLMRQTVLYLLGAPGTGKTTLCQQVAESLAENGTPVIYLCLEMSKEQMLARSISRLSAQGVDQPEKALTSTQVLRGYEWTPEQKNAVYEAASRYRRDIMPRIKYNPAGIGGDLDSIQRFLDAEGQAANSRGAQAPVIFLDYLHLVSSEKKLDAKEIIKKAVEMLKKYAIQYNTAAVAISATNRDSQGDKEITINSGRDSSNIEYSADLMLSLDFTKKDGEKRNKEDQTLKVIKNRFGASDLTERLNVDLNHSTFYGSGEWMPAYITPFDKEVKKHVQPKAGRRI